MDLSTRRWAALGTGVLFLALAAWLLRDALAEGQVAISAETLRKSLPWAAVMDPAPAHNRYVGDQARIFYPYLMEAARVYAGEADALWSSRGGGGLPFLGNMTSALFHPLTWLAAVVPIGRVPLLQGLAVIVLSAWFTFLFMRRLGAQVPASIFAGLAFGFGGHQVLWLQYALSHTLMALPFCFWAIERLVQVRSRSRVAVLSLGFALLVFGGHPETTLVCGGVAGLWALYRLWDHHGRSLVLGAVVVAVMLSAAQWLPFLDYALGGSHGLHLRRVEAARGASGVTFGAGVIFAGFLLLTAALLRESADRGVIKRLAAVASGTLTVVMARRMGMAMSGFVSVTPDLYGSPLGGGVFTGAQDYPGLNAGYAGVLPLVLMLVGVLLGLGGGFLRFFSLGSLLLWGAAHKMPAVESLVRTVPGLSDMGPTRLLGPLGFLVACGGAMVLDTLTRRTVKPGVLAGAGRLLITLMLILGVSWWVLNMQTDPHGGRTIISELRSPDFRVQHDGNKPVTICFDLAEPVDELRVMVDRRHLRAPGPHPATIDDPVTLSFPAQRAEEGRHRLVVEVVRDGKTSTIADQPLSVRRTRHLVPRDIAAIGLALMVFAVMVMGRRRLAAAAAVLVVAADVLSFADGYNAAADESELYPRTEAVEFLQAQEQPFRIFTEGTILPPDTNVVVGLDHVLSYDNIGYHRLWQWLSQAGVEMDHFATFSFSSEVVDFGHHRFDALDIRYVLTEPDTELFDVPGMELVHESELRVWENTDNLGRAFVVGDVMVIGRDPVADLDAADPGRVAILEEPVDVLLGGRGQARVVQHAGRRIEVEVEVEGHGLLVLAENRARGWKASVDGGPWMETIPCDVAWQAVPVSSDSRKVVFRYAPAAWAWGRRISVAGLVLWLALLLWPRRRY